MRVTCRCGRSLEVAAPPAGGVAACPACGQAVAVPADAAAAARERRRQCLASLALWSGLAAMAAYVAMIMVCLVLAPTRAPHAAPPPMRAAFAVGILTVAAAVLSLLATVCGIIGRRSENSRSRGAGGAGLVFGLVGIGLLVCCMSWIAYLAIVGYHAACRAHPPAAAPAPAAGDRPEGTAAP
jgi:hypothetical protein